MRMRTLHAIVAVTLLIFVAADHADTTNADKAALAPLQHFVGEWKGVGQVKRGSNQGAWTETARWAWQFSDRQAALEFKSTDGKYYTGGRLTAGEKPDTFLLMADRSQPATETTPDTEPDRFTGALSADGVLTLENRAADEAAPARITIRMVAGGDRLVTLYERKVPGTERFVRMSEVGLTRKGSMFAKGTSGPECIVTGGYGSIEVQHAGKTYFVCCGGCRDLFNDDPAAAIAEYQARQKDKQAD